MDALEFWRGHCCLLSGRRQYGHTAAAGAALWTFHRGSKRVVDFGVAQTIHHSVIDYKMLMAAP